MLKNKFFIKICLLIIFIIIIILVVKNVLLNVSSSDSINDNYVNISNSYKAMSDNLKMMKLYEDKQQELFDEINNMKILKNINQEEIINILDESLKSCNINASKIAFSEVQSAIIENTNSEMLSMSVNIEFTSSYDDMILFIDEIQNNKTEISIADIRIINSDEGGAIRCTINLNFYALPL